MKPGNFLCSEGTDGLWWPWTTSPGTSTHTCPGTTVQLELSPSILGWTQADAVSSLAAGWTLHASTLQLPSSPVPGWTLDLCCSLVTSPVSGLVSFCSWLDSLGLSGAWFTAWLPWDCWWLVLHAPSSASHVQTLRGWAPLPTALLVLRHLSAHGLPGFRIPSKEV